MPIIGAPLAQLIGSAGTLSLGLRLTVYATLYLALAERLDVPFVTADRELHDRASADARLSGLVRWIGDVETGKVNAGTET